MPTGSGDFCVYTIYRKDDGRDVYIGATHYPTCRKQQHSHRFDWDIYDMLVIHRYQTREESLASEKELIQLYQPEFNIIYTTEEGKAAALKNYHWL